MRATHASSDIVLFGASFGPASTYTNSMGFRTPSFKHASLNSLRDRSARKSSIYEAAELLPCFPFQIAVVNRTVFVFFHMQHKQMGSTYAFPQLGSHDLEVSLYLEMHQILGLLF